MSKDDEFNEMMDKMFIFMKAASMTGNSDGVMYEFKCPLCEGKARAKRNKLKRLFYARCHNCGVTIM